MAVTICTTCYNMSAISSQSWQRLDMAGLPHSELKASSCWLSWSCQSTNKRIKQEVNCNEVGGHNKHTTWETRTTKHSKEPGYWWILWRQKESSDVSRPGNEFMHCFSCILPETLASALSDFGRVSWVTSRTDMKHFIVGQITNYIRSLTCPADSPAFV
jgi:hypothetical protein